jgi:hypothetical protein
MNAFNTLLDDSTVLKVQHAVRVTLKVRIVGNLLVAVGKQRRHFDECE